MIPQVHAISAVAEGTANQCRVCVYNSLIHFLALWVLCTRQHPSLLLTLQSF